MCLPTVDILYVCAYVSVFVKMHEEATFTVASTSLHKRKFHPICRLISIPLHASFLPITACQNSADEHPGGAATLEEPIDGVDSSISAESIKRYPVLLSMVELSKACKVVFAPCAGERERKFQLQLIAGSLLVASLNAVRLQRCPFHLPTSDLPTGRRVGLHLGACSGARRGRLREHLRERKAAASAGQSLRPRSFAGLQARSLILWRPSPRLRGRALPALLLLLPYPLHAPLSS